MKSISFRRLAFVALTMFGHVAAQEEYTEDKLKTMSEEELEKICRIRGFEIMRDEIDPSTGLPHELSHDDYVEAARRCLAIEEEMYVGVFENRGNQDAEYSNLPVVLGTT